MSDLLNGSDAFLSGIGAAFNNSAMVIAPLLLDETRVALTEPAYSTNDWKQDQGDITTSTLWGCYILKKTSETTRVLESGC